MTRQIEGQREAFEVTPCLGRLRKEDGFLGYLVESRSSDIGFPENYLRTLRSLYGRHGCAFCPHAIVGRQGGLCNWEDGMVDAISTAVGTIVATVVATILSTLIVRRLNRRGDRVPDSQLLILRVSWQRQKNDGVYISTTEAREKTGLQPDEFDLALTTLKKVGDVRVTRTWSGDSITVTKSGELSSLSKRRGHSRIGT